MIVTKSFGAICIMTVLCSMLSIANADDIPKDALIPIVVVNTGKKVNSEEAEAIARGLGSPSARGSELIEKLGLIVPCEEGFAQSLKDEFKKAQDDFFSGDHKAAEQGFADIISRAHSKPNSLLDLSPVRELVFKSHIYRAIVAWGEKDENLLTGQIDVAAKSFLNSTPSPTDFPPWVIKKFEDARKTMKSGVGSLVLEAPKECELDFMGERHAPGIPINDVKIGDYALSVDCSGQRSPAQRVFVSEGTTVFSPIVLKHSVLKIETSDLILETQGNPDNYAVEQDVVSLAKSGKWERMIAIVGRTSKIEVMLVDANVERTIRSVAFEKTDETTDISSFEKGVVELASPKTELWRGHLEVKKTSWYRNVPAWVFFGAGVAALGAGVACAKTFGSPSKEELWIWALLTGGLGSAGTGLILFFVPDSPSLKNENLKSVKAFGLIGRQNKRTRANLAVYDLNSAKMAVSAFFWMSLRTNR